MLLVGLLLRHLLPVWRGVEEGKPAQDRGLRDAGQRPGLPQERPLQLSVQRPGGEKTQGTALSAGEAASSSQDPPVTGTGSTGSFPTPSCTLRLQSCCYFSKAPSLRQRVLIRICVSSRKPQPHKEQAKHSSAHPTSRLAGNQN